MSEIPQVNGKATPPVSPLEASAATSDAPRRRGRPPGSKNAPKPEGLSAQPIPGDSARPRGRPRKPHVELDAEAIARQVRGIHGFIAVMLKAPELNLSEVEAAELAKALVNFSREFGFEPDPKLLAAVELAGVAGVVYIPRVIAIGKRVKSAKRGQTIEGTAQPVDSANATAPGN